MRTRIDGVEYEIQTYQGKHSHEYLLSETKDGKVEGRCQLFRHGILSLAWTVKNGKREGEITEYFGGKALYRENWKSIFGEDGNRRMIKNTKEGLIMTIRCPTKHGMNDEEEIDVNDEEESDVNDDENNDVTNEKENDEIVIYQGGYDKEMNRHGHGIEYDIESGKEKLEGYWEKDKLVRIIREFDIESNQMIEYVVNDNLELWNRIPVYIGGYCKIHGTFVRNGIGYLIDENNGTAIRESIWKKGVEEIKLDLYEGWYMKGLQESIRSVLKNTKPEEIKNETSDVIGNTVTIKKSEELIIIDKKVNDLVISYSSCNDVYKLHLNQFNWLRSIDIGGGCFRSVKSFELNGLNRLKTLKIGNSSFGNTEWMNLSNLISLESIEIGDNSFDILKFVELNGLNGLNGLKTIKIGSNSFTQVKGEWFKCYHTDEERDSKANNQSKSFHILNCESLESIQIGEFSFSDFGGGFELKNLPQLQSIQIGTVGSYSYNFHNSSLVIRGIELILNIVMIRSSKSTLHYNRQYSIWKFTIDESVQFDFFGIN